MTHRPFRTRRLLFAATTGVAIAAAAVVALPALADDAAPRTVDFHGYAVDVPESWRVVDLTADPQACVRFDTPAIYFGTVSDRSSCPARVIGSTSGILIQPLTEATAAQTGDDTVVVADGAVADAPTDDQTQLAVEEAGVLVSAVDSPGGATAEVLGSARITDGADRTALSGFDTSDAEADPIVAPGTYNDKAFDACTAQSQSTMDAWKGASPYSAVGIYVSGTNRGCSQDGLTADWVTAQYANGWQFILTDVGLQAPCSTRYDKLISTDPDTARQQGNDGATAAMAAAQDLGFGAGSAIYADIEGYDGDASCTTGVLSYVSGWTETLNEAGWLGGMYSSGSSGIQDLCAAAGDSAYTMPDHMWFAWWNDTADTNSGQYCSADLFADGQRIHQYAGNVTETYGGATVNIDRDFLDVVAK